MENIREVIKHTIKLNDLITKRSKDLFEASGGEYRVCVENINFTESGVSVKLEEVTRHDCPSNEILILSIAQLELSEDEWILFIDNRRKETLEKKRVKQELENLKNNELNIKEYNRLKNELGL